MNPTDEVIDRTISLDELTPHPRNYKAHPAAQVERLAASLQAFGQPRTIAVWRGTILAGHGVTQAARHLGWRQIRASVVPDAWTAERAQAYVVADNETQRGAEVDEEALAALIDEARQTVDLEALGFDEGALEALLASITPEQETEVVHQIQGHSDGYDFREIHAGKLAYRVEAAWRADDGIAIDLYSGQGQLAAWYQRRFASVLRIDQEANEGIDHVGSAGNWLQSDAFARVANEFVFIDFDDEGSPLREVATLFDVLPQDRIAPFVLCVTDGSGLNLKLHGKLDPSLYALDGTLRNATTDDYYQFETLVQGAVKRIASARQWKAALWSTTRGSEGNVCYQTYLISREE